MRLVTYEREMQARTGALLGSHTTGHIAGHIVDLNRAHRAAVLAGVTDDLGHADTRVPIDMVELLAGGQASLDAAGRAVEFVRGLVRAGGPAIERQGLAFPASSMSLLSPVLRPSKVVCLGLNYRPHAAEARMDVPEVPLLFLKVAGSLCGHGQPILIPRCAPDHVDYEGELVVIIGRRGKHVSKADAMSYVAGYTVGNDVSARDIQLRTSQWAAGKMPDAFCPLGPALVTRDEVPDPHVLRIRTLLNGQVMQDANTEIMIFDIPTIVSFLSSIVTIEPGDVILTGTPEGIGHARKPPVYMKPGDSVTVEIETVGTLTNPVVAE